jgi:hypothetical protein
MRRSAWAKMTCRKILTTTNRIGVHTDVVSCRFRFTAKLWKGFAHERNATVEDERLFKDVMEPPDRVWSPYWCVPELERAAAMRFQQNDMSNLLGRVRFTGDPGQLHIPLEVID